MKIAIIGSREPGNINFAKELEKRTNIQSGDTIISGGAKGIDSLAAEYATAHGLALVEIRPDYAKNGRGATFIRNREIVDNADMVVAFWNGTSKGTKYTIDYANKKGVIKENNVIVFDDILTTGATLIAVDKLLPGKNCLYVVGINNN